MNEIECQCWEIKKKKKNRLKWSWIWFQFIFGFSTDRNICREKLFSNYIVLHTLKRITIPVERWTNIDRFGNERFWLGNERWPVFTKRLSARTEQFLSRAEHLKMENERFGPGTKRFEPRFGLYFKFSNSDSFGTFFYTKYHKERKKKERSD